MIQEYQLRVLPEVAANEQRLKEYLVHEKGLNAREITATRILKRSIDARQRTIYVNLNVRAYLNEMPKEDEYQHTLYNNVEGKPQVIVVGAGPGGLFAALRLIELGLRPVIVERGKDVRERKKDLAQISRQQLVNPESNYSFGEGGAGAYSDGKLYTRSKKRGNVDKILNVFCQHGASTSILVDAHPHIGTDKLPRVIENMRNTIIQCGGEVHFETRMDALLIEKDEVKGIETNTGKTFLGPVILVVPAASGPEQIVVNGMSPSNRGSRWSNSGMVVELRPEDLEQFTIDNLQFTIAMQHDSAANCQLSTANSPLSMMHFQEYLEYLCWQQGNMKQTAPAQRMVDFTKKKLSYDLPETSYAPGLVSSPLHFWMPSFIAERLSKGFQLFGKYSRGLLTNEATMIGVETRTSAPVRITRDKETLQHVRIKGLFPCGEGAGYAGGIVSAGIDGERCAEAAKAFLD